ncbi:MAG TPA: glycosyltransferase, partial [Gemmatimonadaceae bacterium]
MSPSDSQRRPIVSIVIPCYNAGRYVREAIESVLRQSPQPVELIVVDDASTDESWNVVREFGNALLAERNTHNRGACYSRNRGTALASGRFLMFLDADDCIAPDTVAALVSALESSNAGLAASRWNFLVPSGDRWIPVDSGFPKDPPSGDFLFAWLSGWYIPPCALMWRRSTLEQIGGWDESLAANQDGDLVLRALLAGMRIQMADGGLGMYRK